MSGTFVSAFGVSFALSAVSIARPNLVSSVVSREVSQHGFWAGPLILAGHALLELPCALGLALVLAGPSDGAELQTALWMLGGVYLVWMGAWTAALSFGWGNPFSRSRSGFDPPTPKRGVGLIATGALATVVNPIWFAWWLTAAAALTAWAGGGTGQRLAAIGGGHLLADAAWLTFLAASVAAGRKVLDGRAYRTLGAACGVALIGFGAAFLYAGIGDSS